jgi:hypothetical protein
LVTALEELLEDSTAGDPITGLRWTHKTLRNLERELRRQGYQVGRTTVARLMRNRDYSLRTNRKRLARTQDPDRDRQFRFMARQRQRFLRNGWPVISVDTKKKELIGNFKNPGTTWRKDARDVLDHDFPNAAEGRGIPFGLYDEGRNTGFVVVGTSRETADFATAATRTWWLENGRWCYPKATRWLLEADCGGANGYRVWAWKAGLQRLADEFGVAITVAHLPPGASKWNRIEHRMFNLISKNWAGEPLTSYELMLNHIRTTTSNTGFRCRVEFDTTDYPAKVTVDTDDRAKIRLKRHKVLPQWNYTIWPQQK